MCEKSGLEERKMPGSATGDKLAASQKAHLQHTDYRLEPRCRHQRSRRRHFNINCGEDTVNQATKCCKEASSEGREQEEKGLGKKKKKKETQEMDVKAVGKLGREGGGSSDWCLSSIQH